MTDDNAIDADPLVAPNEAAKLLEIADSTVYDAIKRGTLPSEDRGRKMVRISEVRRAKLLNQAHVLGRTDIKAAGVTARDVAAAVAAGAARPCANPERKFSLEDVDGIIAHKRGTWVAPPKQMPAVSVEPPPSSEPANAPSIQPVATAHESEINEAAKIDQPDEPPVVHDPFLIRSGSLRALVDYIFRHHDPFLLPPTYWDTSSCPDFEPPLGVHRYTYGVQYLDEEHGPYIAIRRSSGWVFEDAALSREAQDNNFDAAETFVWAPGREAREYEGANITWRMKRADWEKAYYLRRRQLVAEGVRVDLLSDPVSAERRDRIAILRRYHEESWAPSDLPDWFWDTAECPPFERPNDVAAFEYGDQEPDPETGMIGTWVCRSDVHTWALGEANGLERQDGTDRHELVPGAHARGDLPKKYEAETRACQAAELEWKEEWRRRRRMRGGDF